MEMKKSLMVFWVCLMAFSSSLWAQSVVGFWKTVDEKTGKVQSIVAIYEYQNQCFGRIIATYGSDGNFSDSIENPKTRAPGVEGEPFYSGMDIIWNLKKKGDKYTKGNILDPDQGRVYSAEMWLHEGNLVVRGQLLFFGRNQTWLPASDIDFPQGFRKPDLAQLVPQIPKVKSRKAMRG